MSNPQIVMAQAGQHCYQNYLGVLTCQDTAPGALETPQGVWLFVVVILVSFVLSGAGGHSVFAKIFGTNIGAWSFLVPGALGCGLSVWSFLVLTGYL